MDDYGEYYFRIDGVDILEDIENKGLKWSYQDIDGPNTGRTMDGNMERDKIATKIKWELTMMPMEQKDIQILMKLISPVFVNVSTNLDPFYGERSATFYSNNHPATAAIIRDGKAMWDSITFPLIEK